MGVHRTCGGPDEIRLTPMEVELNGSWRVPVADAEDLLLDLLRLVILDELVRVRRVVEGVRVVVRVFADVHRVALERA